MPMKLTYREFCDDKIQNTEEPELQWDTTDELDITQKFDARISQGWWRNIWLREGIFITIYRHQPTECIKMIYPPELKMHYVKFCFTLSGNGQWLVTSPNGETTLPFTVGKYLLRGNGLTLQAVADFLAVETYSFLEIEVLPSVLRSFAASREGELPFELQHIVKSSPETYYLRAGDTTPMMNVVLQQILRCPYQGTI